MTCDCEVCKGIVRFRDHLNRVPEPDRPYWDALYDHMLNLEADLDWYHALRDGSWPEAEQILKNWLEDIQNKA